MGDWNALSAEPPISGGSQDMVISMNPKRQRRPSVRLGEIGDRQSAESYKKRKKKWEEKQVKGVPKDNSKGSLLQFPWGFSKHSTEPLVSGGPGSGNRMSKPQHSGNENLHLNGQIESAIELQRQEKPNSFLARKEHQAVVLEGVMNVASKKMQLDFSAASKRTRRGNTSKAGGTRVSSAVGKPCKSTQIKPQPSLFHSLPFFHKTHSKKSQNRQKQSASKANDESHKGSGEDGFGDPLSNASYDIYTPEGFRHSDLETSDSPRDTKEMCLAGQAVSLEGRVMNMSLSHGQQTVKEVCQNERDELISGTRGGQSKSEETWTVTNGDKVARLGRDTNGVMIMELECETNVNTLPNIGRHGVSSLGNCVESWLNGLGLGRYAQIFEMHEVDMDALHFLTFDDLKEMGINAVGSRRKMFSSIQQLGKSFAA